MSADANNSIRPRDHRVDCMHVSNQVILLALYCSWTSPAFGCMPILLTVSTCSRVSNQLFPRQRVHEKDLRQGKNRCGSRAAG